MPSGWVNTSGSLTSSSFLLNVNDQQNYSLTVDINSTATTGIVTLYANVTGQNATGGELNSTYKTIRDASVTVNAVTAFITAL